MYALSIPDTAKLRSRLAALRVHPWLLFLAVGLVVWLPDGFNIGPHNPEGWSLLWGHIHLSAVLDPMHSRLFRDIPVWLGMQITPRSFVGWQLMIMLLTVLRGALMYEIARRMVPVSRHFAFACGLIAMFHPADSSYFWLNTTGVQFGLMLALASCACALMYLDEGRPAQLAWTCLFQLMSGLTYPAFVPLMFAIPAGAWFLQRLRGIKRDPLYLLKVGGVVLLLLVFEWSMVRYSNGRDARVADFNPHAAWTGFTEAASRIVTALTGMGRDFQPVFLLLALALGAFALFCAWDAGRDKPPAGRRPDLPVSWYAAVFIGLLALAAVAYFPYSISTARDATRRQLLGAGLFVYGAFLFLVFMALRRWVSGWRAPAAVLVLVAVLTTLTGLEKRVFLVQHYRSLESLLATLARLAPHPRHGAVFVIHLTSEAQAREIHDVYQHLPQFSYAIQYVYGDRSLKGSFYGFDYTSAVIEGTDIQVNEHTVKLTTPKPGATMADRQRQRLHYEATRKMLSVPYPRLILVDYPEEGEPRLLDEAWLRAHAPAAAGIHYTPPDTLVRPSKRGIMCTMLERGYRPAYCHQDP